MKKLLIFLLPAILLGCNNNKSISISGHFPAAANQSITVERMDINSVKLIDSVLLSKSGRFKISIDAGEADFFNIGFSDNNFITLLAEPGEKLKLYSMEKILPGNVSVSGSPGTELLFLIDDHLRHTISRLDSINNVYNKNIDNEGFDTLSRVLNMLYDDVMRQQHRYSIGFILKNTGSLASVKALYQQYDDNTYVLNDIKDIQFIKIVADSLSLYYPGSKHTRALKANLNNEMARLNKRKLDILFNSAEQTNLDISLPSPSGDTISLSSLKGKYVLLSFWASWNKQSISENLVLKSLYNKYNQKGFEIYQVSLDSNKEAWERAINFDELPWINVSDLSYPNSNIISLFNVKTIPSNYFIDREGSIVAADLHGKALLIKLEQVFGF